MNRLLYASAVCICATGTAVVCGAADLEQCARNDKACFERNHTSACGEDGSSVDTCINWARVLEKQAASGNDTAAFMFGQALIALAGLTDSPQQARSYQQTAQQTFKSLVEKNPKDAQALIALGIVTEDRDEQIRLLRQGTALAPKEVEALKLLSTVLMQSGDPKDLLEAADLLKQAYSYQTGRNKWHLASSAYQVYQLAGANSQAEQLKQSVKQDTGVRELQELSGQKPERVAADLVNSCDHYALPVLGADICFHNMKAVVQHVSSDRGAGSRQLADSAALAMLEAAESEDSLESVDPAWKRTFTRWLEALMQARYESSAIQLAYAGVTSGSVRLRALEQAARLDPTNGEVAFRLGIEYSERGRWKEAVQQLERAQEHLAVFQQPAVEHHLRIAQENSGERP